VESTGLVPLLKQLSPSMSLESSAQRRGIFSAHPLVFGGGGSATVAWNSFQDDTLARSEQRALGSFNREWARGNSTVQPRTAAVLVFDSRDDAYLAQARMLSQQREAKRAAFLHATRRDDSAQKQAEVEASRMDDYHSSVTRMQLQGTLPAAPDRLVTEDDDDSVPLGFMAITRKLQRSLNSWKSVPWFLDHAARLVPSVVDSSTDLYRAVKGEGWLFDTIVVTDVECVQVATVISRELGELLKQWEFTLSRHVASLHSAADNRLGPAMNGAGGSGRDTSSSSPVRDPSPEKS